MIPQKITTRGQLEPGVCREQLALYWSDPAIQMAALSHFGRAATKAQRVGVLSVFAHNVSEKAHVVLYRPAGCPPYFVGVDLTALGYGYLYDPKLRSTYAYGTGKSYELFGLKVGEIWQQPTSQRWARLIQAYIQQPEYCMWILNLMLVRFKQVASPEVLEATGHLFGLMEAKSYDQVRHDISSVMVSIRRALRQERDVL